MSLLCSASFAICFYWIKIVTVSHVICCGNHLKKWQTSDNLGLLTLFIDFLLYCFWISLLETIIIPVFNSFELYVFLYFLCFVIMCHVIGCEYCLQSYVNYVVCAIRSHLAHFCFACIGIKAAVRSEMRQLLKLAIDLIVFQRVPLQRRIWGVVYFDSLLLHILNMYICWNCHQVIYWRENLTECMIRICKGIT